MDLLLAESDKSAVKPQHCELFSSVLWTLARCCECGGRQRAGAESVWISDEGRSEGKESGGGVGGLDGGCMSLLGLLNC